MKPEYIVFEGIDFKYPDCNEYVLKDLSCSLRRGEVAALVGLSASGKSTFARLAKGLIEPTAGRCYLQLETGESANLKAADRIRVVGWAGPHPELQIFAATVRDEVAFGPANQGLNGCDLSERVKWALLSTGFEPELYLERDPGKLSGGEKRRIALAGIIALQPSYYFFDEPTAGLDDNSFKLFISLIENLKKEGCSVVWITHNLYQLRGAINRLWGLENGRLVLDIPEDRIDWKEIACCMAAGRSFLVSEQAGNLKR